MFLPQVMNVTFTETQDYTMREERHSETEHRELGGGN